jgi:hypothetical protein
MIHTGIYSANLEKRSRYCNSQSLSDITIRYGDQGERVFYGHKIVLSSEITWFQTVFNSGFKVRKRTISLTLMSDSCTLGEHCARDRPARRRP